ncbi:NADH-ubiquinone oxidoreductase [Thermoplasma volcanium GSS1]|uniref:NADH-ubiquinone oxidoreductase n=1 Tax=Thermoplasma volcanium (strain ATCC 51530 / DSM 4299 / JCM 9571 / NBRC 15438 / GSS1) TaxID=273116 RepID=Q97AA3_THEVO|nr:flippase [Thermoplasma volcanium]BAB60049.1 NADH-ubiquinone oxidoreductase [Thermoplasma volcanium GSS1]
MPQTSSLLGIDALYQFTGAGAQLFSGALFYTVIVRFFSASQVGAVALFIAIIGLFNLIFSFGLGTAVQHFASYHLGRQEYATAKSIVFKILILGIIFSSIGLITMFYLAKPISITFMHTAQYTPIVKLLSIVLVGDVLFGLLNGSALGLQLFRASGLMNIIIWITYYSTALVLAFLLKSLYYVVVGWSVGIFLGVILYLYLIIKSTKNYKGRPRHLTPSLLFQFSIPVLLSSIISYGATYIDRFIVAGLMTLSALGVYNFALLVASSIGFIVAPLNNIMLPKFSEFYGEGNRENIKNRTAIATTVVAGVYVPAALGVAVLSKMIITLLAGKYYEEGSDAISIIMVFSALFVTSNVMTQLIAAVRETRVFIYSSAASLASNAILSIILIPHFGIEGASIGFSSIYAASFFVLYKYAKKTGFYQANVYDLAKVWGSSLVMVFVVLAFEVRFGTSIDLLVPYILLGAVVYLGMIKSTRLIHRNEALFLSSLFPQSMPFITKLIRLISSE